MEQWGPRLGKIKAQSMAKVRTDENVSLQSQQLGLWPE